MQSKFEIPWKKDPRLLSRYLLKKDVLLLADVLEAFWITCLKSHKLGPAHFYNTPGLAWQALLKTAAEYCEHEKSLRNMNYAPTSLGLSCLQTWTCC